MEEEKQNLNEEELAELFSKIDPKMLDMLANPDELKEKLEKAGKAWFGWEEIKNHIELFNWAVRTRFEALSTVSALAATLLIIATFNDRLIALDSFVRILLSILLFMIPCGLWGLFYETSQAAKESFEKIYSITEKNLGKEAADKMRAAKKPSFRGAIPLIVYAVLTIVVFAIIWLIWRK